MKNLFTLSAIIIAVILMLSCCGSKTEYIRNEKYTYGTYTETKEIEHAYGLSGSPSQYSMYDFTGGVEYGSKGSYFINVDQTNDGGVIAYGEGLYVYSPDKKDETDVRFALLSECMNKKQKD